MGRFVSVSLGLLVVAISIMGARGRCRVGWLSKYGHCFKIFEEAKNWDDAEMFCRKINPGCHLASIQSGEASHDLAEFVSDYIKKAKNVWIGLHDPRKKDKWQWADRSRVNYVAWADGEPDHAHMNEYCAQLKKSKYLKWIDSDCEELYPFLCQCP